MSIRDGYDMCYSASTEHKRVENQEVVYYISRKYQK